MFLFSASGVITVFLRLQVVLHVLLVAAGGAITGFFAGRLGFLVVPVVDATRIFGNCQWCYYWFS